MFTIEMKDEVHASLLCTEKDRETLLKIMRYALDHYGETELDTRIPAIPEHRKSALRSCLRHIEDGELTELLEQDLQVLRTVTHEVRVMVENRGTQIEDLDNSTIVDISNQFEKFNVDGLFYNDWDSPKIL